MDCYPVVSYTTEEIEERSPIYKDLSTYLQQAKAQFITGELDVDQDWDTYVNTVEQMNAGRLLEIEQAAYDRFSDGSVKKKWEWAAPISTAEPAGSDRSYDGRADSSEPDSSFGRNHAFLSKLPHSRN